ncbi:MAG: adenylate kinase [Porphyromonadaceae bacterium]|jgi:adenylate kinase|nr:adenylate kinase [Porphyromonadaceae bacterium]
MMNLVLFGAPGSGKGTQSAKIIDKYGLYHISTGDVLRDHIARHTDLGRLADKYISKGQLIPDAVMIEILDNVLEEKASGKNGVVFDGFPRTIAQAEALEKLLKKRDAKIDGVIGLEVAEDELIKRMLQRGRETGRTDDNLETITRRLEVYRESTKPLKDYYAELGLYLSVDGQGNVDDIFGNITKGIDSMVKK